MTKFYTNICVHDGKVYHTGFINGRRFRKHHEFNPTCWIHDPSEQYDWKTIHDESVQPINFESISEYRKYMFKNKNMFPIYGDIKIETQAISHYYKKEIDFDYSLMKVFFIDIETPSNQGFPQPIYSPVPIRSIVVKDKFAKKFHVFGDAVYSGKFDEVKDEIVYYHCDDEYDLLLKFVHFMEVEKPDCLVAWNGIQFDYPYIIERCNKIIGKDNTSLLSPLREVRCHWSVDDKENDIAKPYIKGITLLDLMEIFSKYSRTKTENRRLDTVATAVIGEGKFEYEEDNLWDLFINDYETAINYNIIDVERMDNIDDIEGLLELHYSLSFMAKCSIDDAMGSINLWDAFIYNRLKTDKKVIPPKSEHDKHRYAGAYVHEPKQGLYKWFLSFDLNSLYPHCIMQWNISPETLIDAMIENVRMDAIDERFLNKEIDVKDEILAGNGQYFRKDKKGILPMIMEEVYALRKAIKKESLALKQRVKDGEKHLEPERKAKANKELALKIMINSFYGCTGNNYFRYYDLRQATGITLSAQLAIKCAMKSTTEFFQDKYGYDPLIYVDTDSIYLNVEPIVEKIKSKKPNIKDSEIVDFLDKFAQERVEPVLEAGYNDLKEYLNCNDNKMVMKREKIGSAGIWLGKKRYSTMVHDEEGVRFPTPEISNTGVEIKRKDTPKKVKPYLEKILELLLEGKTENDIQEYVAKVKEDYMKMSIEDIAQPITVKNIRKYQTGDGWASGTPHHVKASIVYNNYITKNGYTNLNLIQDEDSIKLVFLKKPNPTFEEKIAFIKKFPCKELEKYVDYDEVFDKSFMHVVKSICGKLGMKIEDNPMYDIDDII
ncbi:DNA polymerase domain-containing protein [uncultured Arcobacter sp.]|uniref:DNA polymerase domain-containing protein n=1 Tax=uncultured Arcobacter sp. TaxID=165434 RepID=UPI0026110EED|nr:DNA polymerase domain-containing protein [uncultured Arcobacter sp.]